MSILQNMEIPQKIPDSGALFVFGGSKFVGNQITCFWLKADVVTSVSCGDEHTAVLTEKGKVYAFGSNDWGQLGLGHTQVTKKPSCIRSLSNDFITLVACGRNHTLVATKDNRLLGFGNNSDHQLGLSSDTNFELPIEITGLPSGKVKKIAAGADFSALLLENGDAYVWGSNSDGQLGVNNVSECGVPTRINVPDKIINIACGYYHTAMVSSSHKLYTFGENEFGKLGTRHSKVSPLPSEVILPTLVDVDQVACGGSHTAFISTDQRLYTFGGGYHGELGHGEDILQTNSPKPVGFFKEKASQVYCGENFTSVITEEGMLYSFGDGCNGKLGLNSEDFSNQFSPVMCDIFYQYPVRFAACGGCHMAAFVSKGETATTETVKGSPNVKDANFIIQKKLDLSRTHDSLMGDAIDHVLRSSLAREKRRKARDIHDAEMPSLNTLNPYDLMEAVKSFPKSNSTNDGMENAPLLKATSEHMSSDDASDISALNKVHRVIKTNGDTSFLPVADVHCRDRRIPNGYDSPKERTASELKEKVTDIPPMAMTSTELSKLSGRDEPEALTNVSNYQKTELNVQSTEENGYPKADGDCDSLPEVNKDYTGDTTESPSIVSQRNAVANDHEIEVETDVSNDQKTGSNILSTVDSQNPEVNGRCDPLSEANEDYTSNMVGSPAGVSKGNAGANDHEAEAQTDVAKDQKKKSNVPKKSKFCILL